MRERLLGRDVLELGARAAAERAAGAGEDEGVDLLRLASLEALEERGVLAVDGQDPPADPARCAASASSPAATRLSLFASARSTPRSSAQSVAWISREADDGVEDDVGLARARAARSGRRRPASAARRRRRAASSRRRRRRARARDAPRRSRSPGGRSSRLRRAARPASCSVYERVRKYRRAGSSARPALPTTRTATAGRGPGPPDVLEIRSTASVKAEAITKYAAGAAKSSASTRSRTPPWPPSSRPVSFTSRSRFSADSNRSPTTAGEDDRRRRARPPARTARYVSRVS